MVYDNEVCGSMSDLSAVMIGVCGYMSDLGWAMVSVRSKVGKSMMIVCGSMSDPGGAMMIIIVWLHIRAGGL